MYTYACPHTHTRTHTHTTVLTVFCNIHTRPRAVSCSRTSCGYVHTQTYFTYTYTRADIYIDTWARRSPDNAIGTLLKLNFPWLSRVASPVIGPQVTDFSQTIIPAKVRYIPSCMHTWPYVYLNACYPQILFRKNACIYIYICIHTHNYKHVHATILTRCVCTRIFNACTHAYT
jgi:hypothetical protein